MTDFEISALVVDKSSWALKGSQLPPFRSSMKKTSAPLGSRKIEKKKLGLHTEGYKVTDTIETFLTHQVSFSCISTVLTFYSVTSVMEFFRQGSTRSRSLEKLPKSDFKLSKITWISETQIKNFLRGEGGKGPFKYQSANYT